MDKIAQNTLYLTTPASYVARDHLTLRVEVPVYPAGLPERTWDKAADNAGFPSPSITSNHRVFGASTPARPRWIYAGHMGGGQLPERVRLLQARLTGVADTRFCAPSSAPPTANVPLARQIIATMPLTWGSCFGNAALARQIIAGKLQNSRNSLCAAESESAVTKHDRGHRRTARKFKRSRNLKPPI